MGTESEQVEIPKALAGAAFRVASEVSADAVLVLTEVDGYIQQVNQVSSEGDVRQPSVIVATSDQQCYEKLGQCPGVKLIKVQAWQEGMGRINQVISTCLREKHVAKNQRLVCLICDGIENFPNSLFVLKVTGEEKTVEMLAPNPILANAVELSLEFSKGGLDRKPIGAAFMIGDTKTVLKYSYQLYRFNPFENYKVSVDDRTQWDLLKKYALAFDGAFVVDDDGGIVAACRYLDADRKVEIPKGLGTRHLSVASMTAATGARGVTVSGEDGLVRIFEKGKIVAKINPYNKIIEYTPDAV